jgi:ABC-type microcin C transport system permease subunit YejB
MQELKTRFTSGLWIAGAAFTVSVLINVINNVDQLKVDEAWKSVIVVVGTAVVSQITKYLNKKKQTLKN